MSQAYNNLLEKIKESQILTSLSWLLEWDQETAMPEKGIEARAEQLALTSKLQHELITSDEFQNMLEKAQNEAGDDPIVQTNIRETIRSSKRAVKIPKELVADISHTTAIAKNEWVKAREQKDFSIFAPHLHKNVENLKKIAEYVGYEHEKYDALLDEHEPETTASEVAGMFESLVPQTVDLLKKIQASKADVSNDILHRHYPRHQQEKMTEYFASAIGYDFKAGHADVAVHPFCVTIGGPGDVRITTRYQEDALMMSLFGTIHEAGHALYEQGMLPEHRFTPMGEPTSSGIHESQSRLWENIVGRSKAFWEYHYSYIQNLFPDSLSDVSLSQFQRAVNTISPSFIRVEADELTYNLHIAIRFDLERKLIENEIETKDVPQAWNQKYEDYLGITPPDDKLGCLQDIHWSIGYFGYFPTYMIGNLCAAQFYNKACQDIPDMDNNIRNNNHKPLLEWLQKNIHQHGKRYSAKELVQNITGSPISAQPYMDYVKVKYSEVYQLD